MDAIQYAEHVVELGNATHAEACKIANAFMQYKWGKAMDCEEVTHAWIDDEAELLDWLENAMAIRHLRRVYKTTTVEETLKAHREACLAAVVQAVVEYAKAHDRDVATDEAYIRDAMEDWEYGEGLDGWLMWYSADEAAKSELADYIKYYIEEDYD